MVNFEIIEERAVLEELARQWATEKVLAFDTEADSFYHYFDKTCLIQVASSQGIWLIDPLAMNTPEDLEPLGPLFSSPKIEKVFHAGEYDLFVLKRDFNFEFQHLFDTMVSAQLLGYEGLGLAAIVKRHFDIDLPKEQQRSDWSRRPLKATQLSYAAADVKYLISLSQTLKKELREKNRLSWAEEEFESLIQREWPDREFDETGYLKIKGARQLNATSLSVLRELYLTRDTRSREIDRPPFKVLSNRTLLEIAETHPQSNAELQSIRGITDLILRRMGNSILDAVKRGSKEPHGPIQKRSSNGNGRKRMDRRAEKRYAALREWRAKGARREALDPGVLCPNSTLEAIACEPPQKREHWRKIPGVKQWFVHDFGREVMEVLASAQEEEPPVTPRRKKSGKR